MPTLSLIAPFTRVRLRDKNIFRWPQPQTISFIVMVNLPEHKKRYPFSMGPQDFSIGREIYVEGDQASRNLCLTAANGGAKYYITSIVGPTEEEKGIASGWGAPPLRASVTARQHSTDQLFLDDLETIYGQVKQYVSRIDVEDYLKRASLSIPPNKIGLTDARRSSAAAILTTVSERLELCDNLSNHAGADVVGLQQRNLVVYLLLTCFDRLGQPHQFSDFGSFLCAKKGRKKELRDSILVNDPTLIGLEYAQALYGVYQQEYGVKNSFMRFIEQILNDEIRNELFSSVMATSTPYRPHNSTGALEIGESDTVKKLLFQIRNNYTHRAEWTPGLTIPLPQEIAEGSAIDEKLMFYLYDQRKEKMSIDSIAFSKFPKVLFDCIRYGMAQKIKTGDGLPQEVAASTP